MKKKIILVELFSGAGGFAKGLEEAGFEIMEHYFSEVDLHAVANYLYNFKNAVYVGSVTDVRGIIRTVGTKREYPLIITFGSPCQDLSLAGKRAGLEGSRSSLIKYALFLIKWLKPDAYIWENVKGAFSSNNGADYWTVIKAFANLDGYRFEQQLLNTSWVLPQNRERIYLVGYLRERGRSKIFPLSKNGRLLDEKNKTKKGQTQAQDNNARTIGAGRAAGMRATDTFIELPAIASCLTNGGKGDGLHSDMTVVKLIEKSYTKGNSQGLRVYEKEGLSTTLSSLGGGAGAKTGLYDVSEEKGKVLIRRLTEIECERLQGFDNSWQTGKEPTNWTKFGCYPKPPSTKSKKASEDGEITYFVKGRMTQKRFIEDLTNKQRIDFFKETQVKEISSGNRYKLMGNAVSVPLVKDIGSILIHII